MTCCSPNGYAECTLPTISATTVVVGVWRSKKSAGAGGLRYNVAVSIPSLLGGLRCSYTSFSATPEGLAFILNKQYDTTMYRIPPEVAWQVAAFALRF